MSVYRINLFLLRVFNYGSQTNDMILYTRRVHVHKIILILNKALIGLLIILHSLKERKKVKKNMSSSIPLYKASTFYRLIKL